MSPLIATSEDADRLRAIAATWIGTPWVSQGMVKGTGASCTGLPYAILAEFGHAAPVPPPRLSVLKRDIFSACDEWLTEQAAHFAPIETTEIVTGDVLLFDCGIGHMAIALGGFEIVHSWQNGGAHYSNFKEAKFNSRLRKAWRPIK
jgi:cell wall-associated NlpC family hydrolase